ncbi:hypothetical protein [uncultured Methanobrevibacter sp.]|uniref:hypothetical protein n=1 Tax=uncultured Methanobrevibacter sp. TaxID=253161 RepID=UPI0025CECC5F|nr:hypothetical protein [uncultured Methanobrevibacter sp.]
MSSKNKVNPNINKFFNKLYLSFQNIITIDKSLILTEEEHKKISFVYCNNNKTKWFAKTENNDENLFLFGKVKDDLPKPALLVLTFDKISVYSPNCSGIINSKQIYINVQYFIDNYPNFKTELTETTIDVFVNGHATSIDVIKLGEYSEDIEELINNLDILLDELENYQPIEKPKKAPMSSENESQSINNKNTKEHCEICGKQLKRREKILCKKCSKKRHAANILTKLLTHTKPNIPFTKKDLKEVYLEREINDFIWSLQDFNLIKQRNNEYWLVEQEILDEFIEKYSFLKEPQDKEVKQENQKQLNKSCSICKKTLPISKFYKSKKTSDGFEDYCKKCKGYVTAASYLKYLLDFVQPGGKFKIDDLRSNYDDKMDLKGIIWKLQEFDLISYDEDNEEYCLENQETCQNFLDEYYINGSITIKTKVEKTKEFTKKEQMDIVIENIKNGKTDKEAAKNAGITLYKITYWFNEGKNNSSNETVDFYKRYIEAKKEAKMNSFNHFYVIQSYSHKQDLTIADTLRKQQMENVLKEIGSGSSLKTAAFNSSITYETLQYWYKRGKQNFGEEYNEFYEKINILQSPIEAPKVDDDHKPETEKDSQTNDRTGHILDPLPKEYEDTFKSSKNNKTGFAWVNKVGNQWFYSRNVDGQPVKFSNYDIYKLYEEVLENNMIWGVRDLVKARQSLKEPTVKTKTPVAKSSTNLITINVPVEKKDKKSLKLLAERNNRSMRDLLTEEANNILNENKSVNPHIKPKNSVYLLFQIDDDLKNQVNDYSSDFNDFWNTALDNILNKDKSDVNIEERNPDLDFYNSSENSTSKLVTINVKVDKQDKKRLKAVSELSNTTMKDLLNNEAMKILNENKTLLPFNKTGDTAPLLFQLDEYLKTQIETYSLKNNKNVRDFWYTALYNITSNQKSEDLNSNEKSLEINETNSKTDITITYVRLDNNEIITIIQGLLDNKELINSLNQLKVFEDNIFRIITNKNNDGIDLFIEMNIPLSYINDFEEIMSSLNWKINK